MVGATTHGSNRMSPANVAIVRSTVIAAAVAIAARRPTT
jgi:hypothetical protein